ncbi:uncharacterized protein LOC142235779 [Haematobia irritans]|uniref:uncharacterized protein LOC142235779 n=1 Tax=Haematobia irritans TaxID=7368 RepID=UPI003F4F9AC6
MVKGAKREQDLPKSRDCLVNSLNRSKSYIFKNHASMNLSELETRLSLIESVFTQLCTIQTSIEQESEEDSELDKRQRFEEIYCDVKSKILTAMKQKDRRASNTHESVLCNQTLNNTNVVPSRSSNLPKLKLPNFSGKYTEWTNWFNTFSSIVDSDHDLDDLSKFIHLRSCLGPIPLGTIEFLELTGANYVKALGLLKKRFENRSVIFQSHVKELFDLERISVPSSESIRRLIDVINSHLHSLESLGSPEELKNMMVFYLARLKLDDVTLAKWHECSKVEELPSWNILESFLVKRCLSLESCEANYDHSGSSGIRRNSCKFSGRKAKAKALSVSVGGGKLCCPSCNASHKIFQCPKFLALSPQQKYFEAKKFSICILCLEADHAVRECKSKKCEKCGKPHHVLLHRENLRMSKSSEETDLVDSGFNAVLYSPMISKATSNFLATARILVRGNKGQFREIRCILDSGSQLNFITSKLVSILKLPSESSSTLVSGIGNSNSHIEGKVNTLMKSRVTDFCCKLDLHILPVITNYSPTREVNVENWNLPNNIKLADPYFHQRGEIDVLLGVGVFFKLLAVGQIKLADHLPILQKSLLGWIVVGDCNTDSEVTSLVASNGIRDDDGKLRELVERFWYCEELSPEFVSPLSLDDQMCEDIFISTVQRSQSGRFIVRLPFRELNCSLGKSYNIALKRFLNLERKLELDSELRNEYLNFIDEYESLGHLETLSDDVDINSVRYFMPHRPVFRLQSSTTKLRVVFDASSKTDNGFSLNDHLLVGARLQPDIFDILIRFRSYRYVITADVAKMFRQVLVHEDDCMYQCILWRPKKTDAIKVLKLRTVTYGTSAAPFLAVRCLNYLADHFKEKCPLGSQAILENFYMDDMLAGSNSMEGLLKLKDEIIEILSSGGFDLHKWRSNCINLNFTPECLNIKTEDCAKALGIMWDSRKDIFSFSYVDVQNTKCSKRIVLSEVAKLYDPLGLINPVVVLGKIFLQHLWCLKLDWDESLPQELVTRWIRFRKEIPILSEIEFDRSFWSTGEMVSIELHGFSDASLRAYGAVVYARACDADGKITVVLVASKSRVAPLKSLSLPRLELQGAVLLAGLMNRVKKYIAFGNPATFYWTDSTLVLQWLASHPSRWSTFIANRVSKIHSTSLVQDWYKIEGRDNQADIVSRGMYPSELKTSELWFKGPKFLNNLKESWPIMGSEPLQISEEMEERRAEFTLTATASDERIDLVSTRKFSNNFPKLQRVFAYIYRWRMSINSKLTSSHKSFLTIPELNGGLEYIIFNIQNIHFFEEKQNLILNRSANLVSIQKLNPFLDNSRLRLLRVGGRLTKAELPFEVKHPILLPGNHVIITSLVDYIHRFNLHPGATALMAFVRQRFWILNIRKIARRVVRRCLRCFRHNPKPLVQFMGDLPSHRVNKNENPFFHSGMDFAGPISVHYKIRGKRPYKVYLAIFVCFQTKACHLEVVTDLSTDSFILALKRFFARRGLCSHLYCDNATNFVGAARRLNNTMRAVFDEDGKRNIDQECSQRGVQFHFIPPRTPHFGGLWESAVKIAKQLIVRHTNAASLTYEELNTVVTQVEAVMNSRPLCPLSPDPNDLDALTPGHFLIGRALNSLPDHSEENDLNISHFNRWKRISAVHTVFWRRWSKEYLTLMQVRMKWHTKEKSVSVGTLVVISEDNLPPTYWMLGRVVETHSGADGLIRVVTLRTKRGILKRGINRICPLPLE